MLAPGLVFIVAWLPTPCDGCDARPTSQSPISRAACQPTPIPETILQAKHRPFEGAGWSIPVEYDAVDGLPPLHVSMAELGGSTGGWISRRGRRERWQVDAWQVTSVSPLPLNPDAHVHLYYRIPLRRRR